MFICIEKNPKISRLSEIAAEKLACLLTVQMDAWTDRLTDGKTKKSSFIIFNKSLKIIYKTLLETSTTISLFCL